MLIRFEVSNFRSIREPAELSMVAIDRDRREVRPAARLGESLLCVAGIFGPNASGKTNVVAALSWLCEAVATSFRRWDAEIPVEPFGFAEEGSTTFEIDLLIEGVRFAYELELDRMAVRSEALYHYPESRPRRIFERSGNDLKLQRGLGKLTGLRQLLTDRTLVLSAARRYDDPLIDAFNGSLLAISPSTIAWTGRRNRLGSWVSTDRLFESASSRQPTLPGLEQSTGDRDQALAWLRLADLGIDDVEVIDDEITIERDDGETLRKLPRRRVQMLHRFDDALVPLDLDQESDGTRAWYRIIGPVLAALRRGSVLLVDELDSHLHPVLSAELVRAFRDPAINPRGAQLIFTAHDTSLLNELNRDEVWLTEKGRDGGTRLGALAEFAGERVRKSQNLGRGYLSGRFGAVPEVDRVEFLRALKLIG